MEAVGITNLSCNHYTTLICTEFVLLLFVVIDVIIIVTIYTFPWISLTRGTDKPCGRNVFHLLLCSDKPVLGPRNHHFMEVGTHFLPFQSCSLLLGKDEPLKHGVQGPSSGSPSLSHPTSSPPTWLSSSPGWSPILLFYVPGTPFFFS